MKSIRFFVLIFLTLCFVDTLTSQCVETTSNLNPATGIGIALGESLGQQMRACQDGTLSTVEINGFNPAGSAIAKLEIYKSSTGWQNLVWTVDNIIPPNGNGWWSIDLSQGYGVNYTFDEDEIYSIRIWRISGVNIFLEHNFSNPYPHGAKLFHDGTTYGGVDHFFRATMNGNNNDIAEINNIGYPTLIDAINAVTVNDTIHVISDIDESINSNLPTDVYLNIPNDKSVTLTGTFPSQGTIINNGSFNITNCTFTNQGTFKGRGTVIGNFVNNGVVSPGGG